MTDIICNSQTINLEDFSFCPACFHQPWEITRINLIKNGIDADWIYGRNCLSENPQIVATMHCKICGGHGFVPKYPSEGYRFKPTRRGFELIPEQTRTIFD